MRRAVALVGTSHKYQMPGGLASDKFHRFIKQTCLRLHAQAIAEEASCEALSQKGADQSVCKIVADELTIAHKYCDPSNQQRLSLNIQGIQDIQTEGFFNSATQEQTEKRIRESHEKRERFWLQELMQLNTWPTLFICGAYHIDSFQEILKAFRLHVDVVVSDWHPTNTSIPE
jgi:hypothetical protein